ncbi:flagellar basal body rod protein FlgB [Aurantivibrio plasticivorans]
MAISFESALGIHEKAFGVRAKRAELIANNLANSDTPNFKARDVDFRAALQDQVSNSGQGNLKMRGTREGHITESSTEHFDQPLLYRVPMQPSIDGNTVDEHVEHAQFMENALAYQSTFTFLNSKFKGLTSAIRGE